MDLYEAMQTRRTVREFDSRPVEPERLRRALTAGLTAPTHNHLRQWEFILVDDPVLRRRLMEDGEQIADGAGDGDWQRRFADLEPSAREMYLRAVPLQKRMMLTAPELLIVCYRIGKPIAECTKIYELNSLASVWCCIENILLALAAEGLGSVTFIPQNTGRLRALLGVPEEYEIPALLPIGYPDPAESPVSQKPVRLEDKLHVNHFKRGVDKLEITGKDMIGGRVAPEGRIETT